jgi:two-component system chemotaxis sensor kinase CheA
MDAVRAAIDGLGGRVELHSVLGRGTVIRFRLPFTVLLTRVLQVEAGGQAFGIPFEAVAETLQFRREEVTRLGAAEAISWRGRTLPLIALAEALHLPDTGRIAPAEEKRRAVIVAQGGEWSALEVDGFGGQAELLLKPLDGLLAGMKGVAGTALLGDGRVLVVLELQDLMK